MSHQYLFQQEQERREEAERQLCYTVASMENMRRQLIDLQNAYQQQSSMLEYEIQQRAYLSEQVKQQQWILVQREQCDQQQAINTNRQQQLIKHVSAEVRRFQATCTQNPTNDAFDITTDCESLFSREMSSVPLEIPAPAKYPRVDWTWDYSMARLEDMMKEPHSTRNTLFYALLDFHCKRLETLDADGSARCDGDLIKRVNEELCKKKT